MHAEELAHVGALDERVVPAEHQHLVHAAHGASSPEHRVSGP